ncbi:FAD-dependent oxidoreductase [Phaeacidiphilus oryzae]|uniref:FAD-dependent oxidoreductase n=1 Tax=Phaeacidiphilus oryzae TaxID=348818 RepID=UPI000560093B|nr:FAD-dependent oxidoreductase [Phaeacidiphilus oryzae]
MSGTLPVAVIGAGPYGLSTAAHLMGRRLPVRVFGDTMSSWRQRMPAGMYLKSTPDASDLSAPEQGASFADFCRAEDIAPYDERHPIPIGHFIAYGEWFQRRLVPEVEAERVVDVQRRASRAPGGEGVFEVALAGGEEFEARAVVVATGLVGADYVPPELIAAAPKGPDPEGPVSHASQHTDFSPFAGRRVAVVGAGQSALESAALLHEAGAQVTVLARGPRVLWGGPPPVARPSALYRTVKPASPLGPGWSHRTVSDVPQLVRRMPVAVRLRLVKQILGPSGAWWLKERVDGVLPIGTGRRIRRAELRGPRGDEEVVLTLDSPIAAVSRSAAIGSEGGVLVTDHVLAATGYRVSVPGAEWLAEGLRRSVRLVPRTGSPDLDPGYQSSVPGLYFAGLAAAPTFGPLMRFVAGTGFAAGRIAGSIAG